MRILVTGKTGQLATSLSECVQNRSSIEVILAGRTEFDITDQASVDMLVDQHNVNIIINTAAYTDVDRAETNIEEAHRVNAIGAQNVARAAHRVQIPILQISTDYVLNDHGSAGLVETIPADPINLYGRTKLSGELEVGAACDNYAIIRTSWIFSAHGKNFLKTMLALSRKQDEIRVIGDQFGSPTYASDLSVALLEICKQMIERPDDTSLRGIYHVANTGYATWAEFARAIFEEAQRVGYPQARVIEIASSDYPTAARRPRNSRLSTEKFANVYGIQMPMWRDAVRRCVDRLAKDHGGI